MMITDTIENVRKRRRNHLSRKNSALNERIKVVRAEIVKLSFQHSSNPRAKTRLQKQLAGLKQLLLQDIP